MLFVENADLKNVYEREQVKGNFGIVYRHFLHCEDEALYILEEENIYGVISIGDVYRFLKSPDKELLINTEFSCLEEVDEVLAEELFEQLPSTIHEIPVISAGKLLGVMRSGSKEIEEWEKIRENLKLLYQKRWHRETIDSFIGKIRGNLFFYGAHTYDYYAIINSWQEKWKRELWKKKVSYLIGTAGLQEMSREEKICFFEGGEEECLEFSAEYNKIRWDIISGIQRPRNLKSKYFNFNNGYRGASDSTDNAKKKIYVFGPCIALGVYARDNQTIEYYLQQLLKDAHYEDYTVINCGLGGAPYVWSRVISELISEDDIVIIVDILGDVYGSGHYMMKWKNKYYGDILDNCWEMSDFVNHIMNSALHVNYKVNQKIAARIYEDIKSTLKTDGGERKEGTAIQNYFISYDVIDYFNEYFWNYQLAKSNQKTGAIVMNCNPFTKGHRYLIEQAAQMVELLYIFVVEEDKSVFKFADRIEMVREGTADIPNVKVVPSGKYILSQKTFAQYFEKDVVEQIDDMDYDLRIFGEVVAKELGITYRFVGEEPFDKVTKKYNETMKRILGEYDINVVEIPRLTTDEGIVISASKVRECMGKPGESEKLLYELLPESTINKIYS